MALALFLTFVFALFHRSQLTSLGITYIPFTSAFLIMADWITAALLLAEARALPSSPLAVLAAGFFFTGLLNVLRLLAVPSFETPDPTNYTPLLFYLASHAALPLAVIANAWLGRANNRPASKPTTAHSATQYLAGAILLVGGLIFVGTAAEMPSRLTSPVFLTGAAVLLLTIAAMVLLGLSLRSKVDLWLLLALWGWLLETALITLDSPGGTATWFAARALGLASSLFVLFSLIAESSTLYGKSVHQLQDQDHERERRFLIREAVAASVAHELRQPLGAIMLNAQSALRYSETQSREITETLNDIVACSRRANDIIQSTRALFGSRPSEKYPVDFEVLLRGTLDMIAAQAQAHAISVSLVVEGTLNPVRVNTLQIQQALLNILQNAIEALVRVRGRPRTVELRCIAIPGKEHITVRIEDNGPGIEQDHLKKIFTPYFTTRKQGTGLGLMIASLVLEAHGGQITVEPLSPFGTAFVLRLRYDGGERVPPSGANVSQSEDRCPVTS